MKRITEADVLPFLGRNSHIEDGFVVTAAGTAWTFGDYLARRRYEAKPEVKARRTAYLQSWVERNREHRRAYAREWMRQYRAKARAA